MEPLINRRSLKIRMFTCLLGAAAFFTLFVYSVSVGGLIANSSGYAKRNDDNNEDVDKEMVDMRKQHTQQENLENTTTKLESKIATIITRSAQRIPASVFNITSTSFSDSLWTYVCDAESRCTKMRTPKGEHATTLETCNMICARLQLWPKPTNIKLLQNKYSSFNKSRFTFHLTAMRNVKKDLETATSIFMNNLPNVEHSQIVDEEFSNVKINIYVSNKDRKIKISTNESYSLSVTKNNNNIHVNISAPTYFGARHALETLSQLIWFDSRARKLKILHDVIINDSPKFPHRGLMVDTARNYFPIQQLEKVVDGMAASKLNVFHLHLTDSVSFPIVLPNNKIFAEYGSYGPEMVYTPDAIRDLIEYSRIRGIRVILEIDAPSHVNEGWNQGVENLVICGEDDVFNGHLNPENNKTLTVLESIYKDLISLGTYNEMFHIGGDEVNLTCWMDQLPEEDYSRDMNLYWANFTNKMFDTVKSANGGKLPKHIVLWSSPLTDFFLGSLKYKKNIVVQYWYGSVDDILASGYKVIFSTVGRWYLDCGFGPWKPSQFSGVCDPYTPWQTFYKYRPWGEYYYYAKQFLGGEACLWTEQVDVDSLETRIWPRAAAFAERLWSDLTTFDEYDVFTRLDVHNRRLKRRGIKTAAIWPRWCSQNPGKC